jgi:uncharacterized membrane protein (UPF0127 family)
MKNFFKSKTIRITVGNKKLRIKDCKGLSSLRGLMFDRMNNIDGALVYANNIWMPFVKRKLDLLFLDRKFRVIQIQEAVPLTLNPKTWRVYSDFRANYCLEIRSGLVDKAKGRYLKLTS